MLRRLTRTGLVTLAVGSALPLVLGAHAVGAQEKPTVAVRQLVHGVGTTEADAVRATRALEAGFASEAAVQAVSAPTTPARFVVSGVIMTMGGSGSGRTKLDWRLVDVASGNVVANGVRTLSSSELSDATLRPVAGEIAGAVARTTAAGPATKP